MSWTFVQHVHTRYSVDSRTKPEALVLRAKQLGIEVLAVTDHDTWKGAFESRLIARRLELNLRVILATERYTDRGDLIGMFLEQDVKENKALAFCDAVHEQGGIVVLPHPYKWHTLDDALLEKVDVVEVHNARCTADDNRRADALAKQHDKPELVGPDAHRLSELLLARNEFDGDVPETDHGIRDAVLSAPRRFFMKPGSIWDEWVSQMVKFTKRPNPFLIWPLARGAVRRLVKP